MTPARWIFFWAVLFVVTHLATPGASIRPRIVNAIGLPAYLALYNIVSFGTFIPLVVEFFRYKHAGRFLWALGDVPGMRVVVIVLMFVALVMLAGGFATPSPIVAGGPRGRLYGDRPIASRTVGEPRGMLKVTRHPVVVAIGIFAVAHMLINNTAGDLAFFGSLLVIVIVGCAHQDTRKMADLGEPYRRFVEQTSAFPAAALVSGRQKLTREDLRPLPLAIGIALFAALLAAHPYIFGGHPL